MSNYYQNPGNAPFRDFPRGRTPGLTPTRTTTSPQTPWTVAPGRRSPSA